MNPTPAGSEPRTIFIPLILGTVNPGVTEMASQQSQNTISNMNIASATTVGFTNSQAVNQAPSDSRQIQTDTQPKTQTQTYPQASEDYYPHKIHGLGGPAATTPFLQDFSLVAEAAKRAEMSVIMRDMEGISL